MLPNPTPNHLVAGPEVCKPVYLALSFKEKGGARCIPEMFKVTVEVEASKSTASPTIVCEVAAVDFPLQWLPPDPHVAPSCLLFMTMLAVPSLLCTIEQPDGNKFEVTIIFLALAKLGSILMAALAHS